MSQCRPRKPTGRRWGLRTACVAAALLLALAGLNRAGDGSSDQRFLAGLRERRLFRLAESYCTGRLADPQLSDAGRAELVIELSLTLADWAVNSAPDDRGPLWERALEVTEDFARTNPESPQLLPVRLQGALGLLARGELARQEAQVVAQGEPLLEEARASLGAAIRSLQQLAEEVEDELRARNRSGQGGAGRAEGDRLTVYQLASLRDNIRYQLARAYRNRAQCYPAEGPDWANALTLAVEMLDPLAKLDTAHPLAWKSRIDEIVCYRLLADYPTAQRKIEALSAADPPPAVALRARAEQLRLALATDRLSEAIQLLSGGRRLEGVTSGELDYAFLDMLEAVERGTGKQAEKVIAIGGAVRNEFWMQNKADVCGKLIEAPEIEEATALGAAILAGTGVGLYDNLEEGVQRTRKPGKVFEPDPKMVPLYAELFEIYKEIYPALRHVNRRIFDRFRTG